MRKEVGRIKRWVQSIVCADDRGEETKEDTVFTMAENKFMGALYVDVLAIARAANIKVIRNSIVQKLSEQERGKAITNGHEWIIVYDDTQPVCVCRLTITRLLGRIFCAVDIVDGIKSNKKEVG